MIKIKAYINDIELDGSDEYMTVRVSFREEQELFRQYVSVVVSVDKSIKDIDEIKTTAIKQAKEYLSQILAGEV